jgi:hypothetical protein
VGELAGDAAEGAIQLRGDARFANLRVVADAVDGLSPAPTPDPSAADGRFVRRWRIAPASTLPRGAVPPADSLPPDSAAWEPLDAERGGFVNIARRHATAGGPPDLAWLKTTIVSDRAQTKRVRLGLGHEVWVYVGGKLVFADRTTTRRPAADRRWVAWRSRMPHSNCRSPRAPTRSRSPPATTWERACTTAGASRCGWTTSTALD